MGFDKTAPASLIINNAHAKKSMIKAIKTIEGDEKIPQTDDNVFLIIYKDPDSFANKSRTIYLSRHGESLFNLYGKIGGNATLSAQGLKYSNKIAEHFRDLNLTNFRVRFILISIDRRVN